MDFLIGAFILGLGGFFGWLFTMIAYKAGATSAMAIMERSDSGDYS